MAGLEIIAAEGGSALKDFIDLPWEIYAGYPKWVPPLKKDVRRLLDPRRHPFWEFSERRLFLARRGSKTVGRIAGIIDRHYNELHSEKMGIENTPRPILPTRLALECAPRHRRTPSPLWIPKLLKGAKGRTLPARGDEAGRAVVAILESPDWPTCAEPLPAS